MSSTKRIENRIKKVGKNYIMTTHKVFVPSKGSKLMFREVTVNPIQCTVTVMGTPPAKKSIEKIYEQAIEQHYATLKGHKKLRKKLNKTYRRSA